jgi:predicted nicotinamide N-methyase
MSAEELPLPPVTEAHQGLWLPETPQEAVGPVVEDAVIIEGHTYRIRRPGEPDKLLDHPAVLAAFAKDEYMPYWTDLWPAARMLVKVLLHEPWPAGTEILELGCGLGLPGIVALQRGWRVTFSDYDATALRFAAVNARLNGGADFRLLRLDWRHPPAVTYPVILASDLIYEERNVAPLVGVLEAMLAADGVCLLTDQDRKPAPLLRQTLQERGFTFTTQMLRAGQPGLRVKGTLYRIRKGTAGA